MGYFEGDEVMWWGIGGMCSRWIFRMWGDVEMGDGIGRYEMFGK